MQDTGYGSEAFLRACRINAASAAIQGRGPRSAWRRARSGAPFLAWYKKRLPAVEVNLTSSPAGLMIGRHLGIRRDGEWMYRDAQGALTLPADPAQYLRGRPRQAVRTNVGHARRAGMTVFSYAVDSWVPGVGDARREFIGPGPIERWIVIAADGAIIGDSILSVDGRVALLHGLVSTETHARWLLHTAIVERLCGECEVLLTNGEAAYKLGPGVHHFQQLLGYRPVRLRVVLPRPGSPAPPPLQPAGLDWPEQPMSCGIAPVPPPIARSTDRAEIGVEMAGLVETAQ